jgi:hypothetical protein
MLETDRTEQEEDEQFWQAIWDSLVGLVPDPEGVMRLALWWWEIEADYGMKDGFGGCEHRRLFADPEYIIGFASDAWGIRARMGGGSGIGSPEYQRVFGATAR